MTNIVRRRLLKYLADNNITILGYKTVVNFLKNDPFGKRKISSIKTSDARGWLIDLQKNGRGYSSIHSIRGVLRPAFRLAYEDDCIIYNR